MDACPGEGVHQFTLFETVFWFFMYCTVAVLSFAGNTLLALVILIGGHMQTVTNCLILNLAIADATTGVFIIPFKFQAALLQRWVLPDFMCSTIPFAETVSLSVSVVTLTLIALDRFLCVMFPMYERMGLRGVKIALITIWVTAVVISVPYGVGHEVHLDYGEQNQNGSDDTNGTFRCLATYREKKVWQIYNIYLTIVQYFVPVFILSGAYLCIACKLWLTQPADSTTSLQMNFEKAKRRVVKMLIIVVCLFTFCWLPLETYFVLSEVRPCINAYRNINIIFFCCHWLAMSNSALNPIIYGVYNKKFRRGYQRLIGMCGCAHWVQRQKTVFRRPRQVLAAAGEEIMLATTDHTSVCQNYIAAELGHD